MLGRLMLPSIVVLFGTSPGGGNMELFFNLDNESLHSTSFDRWEEKFPRPVVFVVLQQSGGTADGDIARLTGNTGSSCHRYVAKDGRRFRFLPDDQIARACNVQPGNRKQPHPMGKYWTTSKFTGQSRPDPQDASKRISTTYP